MSNPADPIKKAEAQTLLQNLKVKAELGNFGDDFDKLFTLKAPELKTVVSPEELKTLISAIEAGTADNNKLARFISIANGILNKL
jgi:hypothetical protein